MQMTIDKAGRMVIPVELRRKAGLKPGAPLSASYDNGVIRIERDVPGPEILKRKNRRVAVPSQKGVEGIDPAALVEEERDRWPHL